MQVALMTTAKTILRSLASLWLTLLLLVGIAVQLGYSRAIDDTVGLVFAAFLAGLTVNLLAAIASRRKLRQQGGLLVFHLALAAVALIAAIGQLIGLRGHVELTEGTAFAGDLANLRPGILHQQGLDQVTFIQGPFSVDYAPQMNRRETRSQIVVAAEGGPARVVVGDDRPLVLDGYRFYTSFNKGFAPVLSYYDTTGEEHLGTVHMPPYPLVEHRQGNEWLPPGQSNSVKLWLRLAAPVYDEDAAWSLTAPNDTRLVVIDGEHRHELQVGDSVRLAKGTLRYAGLRKWMGYTIFNDPTLPWLLSASCIGILGLAWHIRRRAFGTPWDRGNIAEAADDR